MIKKGFLHKFEWQRTYFYAALLYSFSIALDQKLATISLIIWAVFSLISYNKTALNSTKYLLALPMLYLTYLLGTLFSGAATYAFLEHKLSFLVFPLIFFLHNYKERQRMIILKAFIYGLLIAALICLVLALNRSLIFEDDGLRFVPNVLEGKAFLEAIIYGGNHFFGNHFSLFHQTVYFGLYLSTAIAILLFYDEIFSRKIRIILTGIFTGILFLVSNKAAFLVLALIFTYRIYSASIPLLKKGLILTGFLTIAVLFAITNPRIKESLRKAANQEFRIDKDARFDFSMRILSWDAAVSLVKERPFAGFGAGNAQMEFNRVYTEKEYTFPLKEQLNAHNQFLQTWVENGLAGLLVLIGIFIVFFRIAARSVRSRKLFFAFLIIVFVNALFESVFNRFSGISFFSFLVCFIFSTPKKEGGDP